jgi:hypothetical protein
MLLRVVKNIRRHAIAVFAVQWLLAGFGPLLHAHSVEPSQHEDGFHIFLDLPQDQTGECAQSGSEKHALTVEVADARPLNKDMMSIAPSLLWLHDAQPLIKPNGIAHAPGHDPINHWSLQTDLSSPPPRRAAPSQPTAPQAP